eukprot:6187584-Pleurochrysis_carterae.AAC.1
MPQGFDVWHEQRAINKPDLNSSVWMHQSALKCYARHIKCTKSKRKSQNSFQRLLGTAYSSGSGTLRMNCAHRRLRLRPESHGLSLRAACVLAHRPSHRVHQQRPRLAARPALLCRAPLLKRAALSLGCLAAWREGTARPSRLSLTPRL